MELHRIGLAFFVKHDTEGFVWDIIRFTLKCQVTQKLNVLVGYATLIQDFFCYATYILKPPSLGFN